MKKARNKKGSFFVILGTMLLLAALFLVLWNVNKDKKGLKESEQALVKLEEQIPESSDPTEKSNVPKKEKQEPKPIDIDGNLYSGIIEIPKIGRKLPVLNSWSYANLDIAPCVYSGSVKGKDLIIAAHNYSSFFFDIDKLNSGDEIIFTECDGERHIYEVTNSELIGGFDSKSMKSGSEDWDLTLFTCNWSGYSRVTVRASEKAYE